MPEQLVPMQGCPVPTCDAEPERTLVTTEPTKLTTQNQVHERICILPREFTFDGEDDPRPAAFVTFHGDLDPIETEEPEVDDAADTDEPAKPDPEPEDTTDTKPDDARPTPPEKIDLEGDRHTVYLRIYEATHDGGTITAGEVKGLTLDADISPAATAEIIDDLVAEGHLDEPEDAVVRAATPDLSA